MLQGEHSAILSTFIKLPFVIRSLFCLFLRGHFTQVLLYNKQKGPTLMDLYKYNTVSIEQGYISVVLNETENFEIG